MPTAVSTGTKGRTIWGFRSAITLPGAAGTDWKRRVRMKIRGQSPLFAGSWRCSPSTTTAAGTGLHRGKSLPGWMPARRRRERSSTPTVRHRQDSDSGQPGHQLWYLQGRYTAALIARGVRDDQFVLVDECAATVNHVRDVPLPLMRIRHQDRLVNPADDPGRIVQVQQLDAEAVGPHRANPVGHYQPAFRLSRWVSRCSPSG